VIRLAGVALLVAAMVCAAALPVAARPRIMVTGYWDPTGRMIRHFSQDPELNPDGWMGEDWEGRGYDIVAFFPDPDAGYTGDFEVDYQDTLADFWRITAEVEPVAILGFGAGNGPWEIEHNARNITNWIDDFEVPFQPDPNPPDDTVPTGYVRHATIPETEVAERVNALDLPGIGPDGAWVDWWGDPGRFLCEYLAYHDMWYQDLHSGGGEDSPCYLAGFIHVRSNVPVDSARLAAEETLRVVIEALDELIPTPTPTETPEPTGTAWPSATPTPEPSETPTFAPDPSATPTAAASPSPSPTFGFETPTPRPYTGPVLELNQERFAAGDPFLLTCSYANAGGEELLVDLYILLDVSGAYWFWPSWGKEPDSMFLSVPPWSSEPPFVVLEFTWPAVSGAGGARFWAAFLEAGTLDLVGEVSYVDFAFGDGEDAGGSAGGP